MKRLLIVAVLLVTSGCTANLQRPYVESMIATEKAIRADVKAGLYKPDARSNATLDKWTAANADALAALNAQEKSK